jgi:hypothetical protein
MAEAIVTALGLTLADLLPQSVPITWSATYDYGDAEGQLLLQGQRQPEPNGHARRRDTLSIEAHVERR